MYWSNGPMTLPNAMNSEATNTHTSEPQDNNIIQDITRYRFQHTKT